MVKLIAKNQIIKILNKQRTCLKSGAHFQSSESEAKELIGSGVAKLFEEPVEFKAPKDPKDPK